MTNDNNKPRKKSPCPAWPAEWPDWGNAVEQRIDSVNARLEKLEVLVAPMQKGFADRLDKLSERVADLADDRSRWIRMEAAVASHTQSLSALEDSVKHVLTRIDTHRDVGLRIGERVENLEQGAAGVAVPLLNVQRQIAALEEQIRGLTPPLQARLDYLQRRIGDLEEDRGLASAQAGQQGFTACTRVGCPGVEQPADDGREPAPDDFFESVPDEPDGCDIECNHSPHTRREPAQPIAGTNSEPSREASLTPGASAGTAKTEAPVETDRYTLWALRQSNDELCSTCGRAWSEHAIQTAARASGLPQTQVTCPAPVAIEVGQRWRFHGERGDHTVVGITPSIIETTWNGVTMRYNPDALRMNATLVEPALKRCAKCDGHGMLYADSACHHCGGEGMEPAPKHDPLNEVRYGAAGQCLACGGKQWAANVPEPPPVEALSEAARHLESLRPVVYTSQRVGDFRAVASWLRACAAAMGGGK